MRGAGKLSQLRGRKTHPGGIRERGRCVEHGGIAGGGSEADAAASQVDWQIAEAIADNVREAQPRLLKTAALSADGVKQQASERWSC